MKMHDLSRRDFLQRSLALAAGAPLALKFGQLGLPAAEALPTSSARANVAIVPCKSYGPQVRPALDKCFDLLGGIGSLVKNKTVTVKVNLTGTNFQDYLGRPVGETYMTHYDTAFALAASLFAAGAKRVRFVESTQSTAALESSLSFANWNVKALSNLGKVEFENTRNLGNGKSYSHLRVPGGGYMFSTLDLNHSYEDTDVMVSLCKLKNHTTAGVTLSMKNLFGLTPNSLYGSKAGSEDATEGRGPLHNAMGMEKIKLPGLKEGITSVEATWRVPRIIADICAARPIHLAIIDGISAMKGGEGPWRDDENKTKIKFTAPGVLIAGLNPVSTDAVGTAVMGYENPRAAKGVKPFDFCDNHILLAEQAGLGTADLTRIDVRGTPIKKVRYPYG